MHRGWHKNKAQSAINQSINQQSINQSIADNALQCLHEKAQRNKEKTIWPTNCRMSKSDHLLVTSNMSTKKQRHASQRSPSSSYISPASARSSARSRSASTMTSFRATCLFPIGLKRQVRPEQTRRIKVKSASTKVKKCQREVQFFTVVINNKKKRKISAKIGKKIG